MRGDGDATTDDLPPSPPKLSFKHQVYETPTQEGTAELDFTEGKEGKPLVLDASIVRYTRFESNAAPAKICDRISEVIRSMSGKTAEKDNFKVKAQFGAITFVAQVFSDSTTDKHMVVDFRKKKGSGAEFRSIYQEIRAQLADIILQPKEGSISSPKDIDVETTPEVEVEVVA